MRESNEALWAWRFPPDPACPPQPAQRLPPRPPRPPHRPPSRRGARSRCPATPPPGGAGCGCHRLRALDKAKAAAAVARGEVGWHMRLLQLLDGGANEADYRAPGGAWDAAGLMSDLRICRGRRLLRLLRREVRRARGGGGAAAREAAVHAADYCHGGDRWDLFALRDDLRISRRRREAARQAAGEAAGAAADKAEEARVAEASHAAQSEARGEDEGGGSNGGSSEVRGGEGVRSRAGGDADCLFYICGAIDGMTDAVVAGRGGAGGEEEEWSVHRVVVEVKNRVRGFMDPPPLYDLLQTVVYVLMLGAHAGDLVQCVRSPAGADIHITRVELAAPPCFHGAAWRDAVLPRLYAFARLVSRFRRDDARRLAYLCADERRRTEMLVRECPFLAAIAPG